LSLGSSDPQQPITGPECDHGMWPIERQATPTRSERWFDLAGVSCQICTIWILTIICKLPIMTASAGL